MDELLEKYLSAVCSYFLGKKRRYVYKDLKQNILSIEDQYDDMEDLLTAYGHPLSIAYTYGYRPIISHIFNQDIALKVEKVLTVILCLYLFFSTTYYLQQFNCIPILNNSHIVTSIANNPTITWILSHPVYISLGIILIHLIALGLLDLRHPANQERDVTWNHKELMKLPKKEKYSNRTIPTYLMIVFSVYFLVYTFIFSSSLIILIQNITYQMIHLMIYFFHPFIIMIAFDYTIDLSRKMYTKKYILFSFILNLFIFVALSVFVFNSAFLRDYLLPYITLQYTLINILILFAITIIYIINIYKIVRDLRVYRAIYR